MEKFQMYKFQIWRIVQLLHKSCNTTTKTIQNFILDNLNNLNPHHDELKIENYPKSIQDNSKIMKTISKLINESFQIQKQLQLKIQYQFPFQLL